MNEDDEYDEIDRRYRETPRWMKGFNTPAALGTGVMALTLAVRDHGTRTDDIIASIVFATVFALIAGFYGPIADWFRGLRRGKDRGSPPPPDHNRQP